MNATSKNVKSFVRLLLIFCVALLSIFVCVRIFGSDVLPDGFRFPKKSWASAISGASFGGGDGNTQKTAYEVSTPEQLALIAVEVSGGNSFENKHIALTADIDLGGRLWESIGTEEYDFCGTLDGRRHTISGLAINKTGFEDYGSFIRTNNGVVKNLSVVDAVVRADFKTNSVAGFCRVNTGEITNCFFSGTVIGVADAAGFVSSNMGVIAYCGANAKVFSGGPQNSRVAVLVEVNQGDLNNSYATGSITCGPKARDCDVGGLVGASFGNYKQEGIFNCYAAVTIDAPSSLRTYPFVGSLNASKTNVGFYDASTHDKKRSAPPTRDSVTHMSALSGDFMRSADFVETMNVLDENKAWVADTKGVNGGYPVPKPPDDFVLQKSAGFDMKYNPWGLEYEGEFIKAALCENPGTANLDRYAEDQGFAGVVVERVLTEDVFYGFMTKERYEEYVDAAWTALEDELSKLSDGARSQELYLPYSPYVTEVKHNASFTDFEIIVDIDNYKSSADPSVSTILADTETYHRMAGLSHNVRVVTKHAKTGEILGVQRAGH
jgi:hypothetical protein